MPRKETIHVAVDLTDAEVNKYAREQSDYISRKARAEDNLKSSSSQIKSEIAGLEANINRLAGIINSGHEYRNIECQIEIDYKKKVKRWRDKDGIVRKEEPASDEDMQQELNLPVDKDF